MCKEASQESLGLLTATVDDQIAAVFANLPDGSIRALGCNSTPRPLLQIDYTAHAVTVRVGDSTTTALSVSDTSPGVGQGVTYTAIVTPGWLSRPPEFTVIGTELPTEMPSGITAFT